LRASFPALRHDQLEELNELLPEHVEKGLKGRGGNAWRYFERGGKGDQRGNRFGSNATRRHYLLKKKIKKEKTEGKDFQRHLEIHQKLSRMEEKEGGLGRKNARTRDTLRGRDRIKSRVLLVLLGVRNRKGSIQGRL